MPRCSGRSRPCRSRSRSRRPRRGTTCRRVGGTGLSSAAAGRTPPAFGSSISRWPRCRCSASDNCSFPASDLDARQYAFQLLFVYTASGLGLLLTTSFLGLRRYLRQRRQEMPLQMVNLWLGIGVALIVGVMFAAMLLPRPNAEYAISDLPIHVGSPDQHASPYGMGREGVEEDQPDARLEPRDDAKPDAPQSDQPGDSKSSAGSNDDAKIDEQAATAANDQQKAEKRGESGRRKPPETAKESPGKQVSPTRRSSPRTIRADGKERKADRRDRKAEKKAKPSDGSGTAESEAARETAGTAKSRRPRSSSSPRAPSVPQMLASARAAFVRLVAEMDSLPGVGGADRLGRLEESRRVAGGIARLPADVGRLLEPAVRRKAA